MHLLRQTSACPAVLARQTRYPCCITLVLTSECETHSVDLTPSLTHSLTCECEIMSRMRLNFLRCSSSHTHASRSRWLVGSSAGQVSRSGWSVLCSQKAESRHRHGQCGYICCTHNSQGAWGLRRHADSRRAMGRKQ
jgi:hypothetical protein